jgi:phosphoribosylglycinamide formyltransferase-1
MTSSPKKLRLAVLISGSGTNLQAILDRSVEGTLNAEIVVVASDRPGAFGLERAEKAGVPAHVVDYASILRGGETTSTPPPADPLEIDRLQKIFKLSDKDKRLERLSKLLMAERQLIEILDGYRPDFICLAGFMRLLTPYFIHHYNKDGRPRILNIHPALLPAFPGQHGYEDTFAYGCRWGGITVHFVDEGEDTGAIIAQAVYPIFPGDDVEKVRRRGLMLEYEVYSQCINWLAAEQLLVRHTENGRLLVTVADPTYPEILKNWLRKAFAST